MGTETLSTFTTTGITLTGAGTYTYPFTVTATGTIAASTIGVYSDDLQPYLANYGTISGSPNGVKFQENGTIENAGSSSVVAGSTTGVDVVGGNGIVVNAGTITGGSYAGVFVNGGTIINASTNGQISGGDIGVIIKTDFGPVTNSGTITGKSEFGVELVDGGPITNIGTSAVITGGELGVFAADFLGYVTNTGTITGGSFFGAYLDYGGTVTNTGAAAVISGADSGVKVRNYSGIVNNTGTITGHSNYGVYLDAGGTVTNAGTSAVISSPGEVGVWFRFDAGTVANTGTITAGTFFGVYLEAGGSATNIGAAAFISGGEDGVSVEAASAAVTNTGTITGTSRYGILLGSGGTVTNTGASAYIFGGNDGLVVNSSAGYVTNSGTIRGAKFNGVYLDDGGTVTNSGTIRGPVAVDIRGTGNARVIAKGGAVFIGKVEAAGTGNTLELAGTGTTVASIGTEFTGFQTITFDPNSDWGISGTSLALADGETITGFYAGNTIDLTNILANAETYANGLLTLANGTTPLATLSLPENPGVTSANFFLQPDNSGGTYITTNALCYLRGTRILTPTGEVPIENIAIGDLLVTRFSGFRRVKWIGRQTRTPLNPEELREHAPVRIRAGALGDNTPTCDLHVSPGHSMLVSGNLLLAKLLVNGVTITQDLAPPLPIEYYQIEFEAHDCIAAHGAWSESFADAPGLRAQFDNAAGYHARYPDSRPPEALSLCAPRPEKGAKLAAALAPIAARAAAAVPPGKLRGWIDRIRAPWTIEGWAWDEANPELPVLLEVLLDGQLIGTLLACAYRKDLAKAGFGAGRCAFTWTAPLRLPADAAARLHLRRASDGAALPGSATLPADALSKPTLRLVS